MHATALYPTLATIQSRSRWDIVEAPNALLAARCAMDRLQAEFLHLPGIEVDHGTARVLCSEAWRRELPPNPGEFPKNGPELLK